MIKFTKLPSESIMQPIGNGLKPLIRMRVTHLMAILLLIVMSGWGAVANAQTAPQTEDMPAFDVKGGEPRNMDLWVYDEETPIPNLECIIVTPPAHGTVTLRSPTSYPTNSYQITYTATLGAYVGPDSFTFKARDPQGYESPTATCRINVTQFLELVAYDGSATLPGGSGICALSIGGGNGSAVSVSITKAPGHGTLQPAHVGNQKKFIYTANVGYIGIDTFRFRANDALTTTAEKTFTISAVADVAPILLGQSYWVTANTTSPTLAGGGGGRNDYTDWQRVVDPLSVSTLEGQTYVYEITTSPQHGTISDFNNKQFQFLCKGFQFTYTPQAGFIGEDYFYARVSNGRQWSQPARYRVVVRESRKPGGALVLVVVDQVMVSELNPEVVRLKADLESEGFSARIVPWSSDAKALWDLLRAEYLKADQCLVGALMLGNIPIPGREQGCQQLWRYQVASKTAVDNGMDIWVSRIKAPDVYQMRYALDANHYYRSGQSRIPVRQWREWSPDFLDEGGPALRQVWPEEMVQSGQDEKAVGTEYFYSCQHDSGRDDYGEGLVTTPRSPSNVRFNTDAGCGSGQLRSRSSLFSRGGHTLISWANANTWGGGGCWEDMLKIGPAMVTKFNDGESLGIILMGGGQQVHPNFSNNYIHWGDSSIGPKRAPSNQVPVITAYTSSPAQVYPGTPVTFSATFSDADGSGAKSPFVPWRHQLEWFATGYDGRQEPNLTTNSSQSSYTSVSHIYPAAHNYHTRVEVMDEWRARGWREKIVAILPDPTKPIRLNPGETVTDWVDPSGGIWLYEQRRESVGWGWECRDHDATRAVRTVGAISGTTRLAVFQSARTIERVTEPLVYRVPLSNGTYTVNLGFADFVNTGVGKSQVDVSIEGNAVLSQYDAYAAAGGPNRAIVRTFSATVTDGELTLVFTRAAASLAPAFINSIEILPLSGPEPHDVVVTPIVTVTEGTSATFTVTASGTPAPTYQWQRNVGGNWLTITGAAGSTYTLTASLVDNEAQFRVIATNSAGSAASNVATLRVLRADSSPVITTQPPDRTIRVGQTATFSVNATGTPAPTIHWQRSPDGTNWSTLSGATSASYVTPIASLSDHQARFRAVATNSVGNVTSMPAQLTVRRRGDANLDGAVDILDLIVIRRAFGTPTVAADLNEDGTVDILDLILVRREFGL